VDVTSFLKSLSEANGVSGYEDAVRDIVREQFEALADVVRTDTMGNLIALKRGTQTDEPRRRLMLAAHMDEIGLIVTRVDKGFLRFTQVGGYDPRTLPGLEVTVHGKRPLHGVIGSRPPHVLPATERRKPTPMADLFIDEFQRETRMVWNFQGSELGRYTLRGSRRAFDEVIACQRSYFDALGASQGSDPFATSGNNKSKDPFAD